MDSKLIKRLLGITILLACMLKCNTVQLYAEACFPLAVSYRCTHGSSDTQNCNGYYLYQTTNTSSAIANISCPPTAQIHVTGIMDYVIEDAFETVCLGHSRNCTSSLPCTCCSAPTDKTGLRFSRHIIAEHIVEDCNSGKTKCQFEIPLLKTSDAVQVDSCVQSATNVQAQSLAADNSVGSIPRGSGGTTQTMTLWCHPRWAWVYYECLPHVAQPARTATTTTRSTPALNPSTETSRGPATSVPVTLIDTSDPFATTPSSIPVTPTDTSVPVTPTATSVPDTSTATSVPVTPTATSVPYTSTATSVPVTPTSTSVPVTPTSTSVPVTPTTTSVPVVPTTTSIHVKPTATALPTTPTSTSVPVTPTTTSVPVTPTAISVPVTPTSSSVPVTPTATSVPVTPTTTSVPVTPTATSVPATHTTTSVPVVPTATAVPATPTATDVPVTPTETDVTVTPTSTDVPVTPTATDVTVTPTSTDVPVTPTATDFPVTPTANDKDGNEASNIGIIVGLASAYVVLCVGVLLIVGIALFRKKQNPPTKYEPQIPNQQPVEHYNVVLSINDKEQSTDYAEVHTNIPPNIQQPV